MINEFGWLGEFRIKVKHKDGRIEEDLVKNRVTNVALQAMINILDNIDPDLNIKYLAVGTGTTALDDNDTQLETEIFRVPFDSSNNDAVGQFTTTFTILDSEAVETWGEIGLFGGDSTTITPNSGKMISRILYTRIKTSLEEIDIIRIDKLVRV